MELQFLKYFSKASDSLKYLEIECCQWWKLWMKRQVDVSFHCFIHEKFVSQIIALLLLMMTYHTLLHILFNVSPKHGKKSRSKSCLIRWWNILPTFGTRLHHVSTIEICLTIVWWNLEPNIGGPFQHLTEKKLTEFFTTFWWNVEQNF